MTTKTRSLKVVDSLSLLSLKVASNVFDLSSGMNHVSIRDQIVRAQLVVRDLRRGDPSLNSLLIVGGGVAGVFAGLAAADLGVSEVVIVDVADQPFSLFRGVTQRYVGPFMYEWPSPFFGDQSYPEHQNTPWGSHSASPLRWASAQPCNADQLATLLTQELNQRLAAADKPRPRIYLNVDKAAVQSFVRTFAQTEAKAALDRQQRRPRGLPAEFLQHNVLDYETQGVVSIQMRPQYVLLASGMGHEDRQLVKVDAAGSSYGGANFTGTSFWANDNLLTTAIADRDIYIFGGGDGAMQDTLRALTGLPHPLQLLCVLEKDAVTKAAIDGLSAILLALDRQGRQYATWTRGAEAYEALDRECQKLAGQLAKKINVENQVTGALRQGIGNVSLFVRESHFGKAYLLNRFLVHLIAACCRSRSMSTGPSRMSLSLHFGHQPVGYAYSGSHQVLIQNLATKVTGRYNPQEIVVRYGIERDTVPGAQMIQVSDRPSRQRTTLARVELPFVAG
ncbi:MAG: hypothetical protein ACK4F6_06960 [Hylemonella sp.]